jgi:hypothetical protein
MAPPVDAASSDAHPDSMRSKREVAIEVRIVARC